MSKGAYVITPLGAAIVEAMRRNDAAREVELQRAFRHEGKCPTSRLFPTKQSVEDFYRTYGQDLTRAKIVGVEPSAD
jgi:hypothetical protein